MIHLKELAQTGLRLLEEAVLAILFSEHPSRFKPHQIAKRLGIEEKNYHIDGGSYYPVIRGVLYKLKMEGRVYPDRDKDAKWGLTESESKARSTMINPKQLAQISLSLLEEAVLAILFMEHPHYFRPHQIAKRLGIEKGRHHKSGYPVIGGLLYKLKTEGRVQRDTDDAKRKPKWALMESEIKARSRG